MLETLYGQLSVPDWPTDLIVRSLREHGEWGAVEADLFARALPDNSVFWDVGAFLGTFSLGVARHRKFRSLLAIEANPDLAPHLEANLATLESCPTNVVSAGVANSDWVIPKQRSDIDGNHGAQDYEALPDGVEPTASAIRCHSLKALRSIYGDYDAMKMDIEGHELEAIKGDYAYIKKRQPLLWLECNESEYSFQLLSALRSLDYTPIYLAFPAFRGANYHGAKDLIYPMAYEAALLAAPAGLIDDVTWEVEGEDIIARKVMTHPELRRALYETPRWCHADWLGLSRAELLGCLGKLANGQRLADFLRQARG